MPDSGLAYAWAKRGVQRFVQQEAVRLVGELLRGATLLKVFIPYLVWNTVFDNTRISSETGKKPAPFSRYSYPLLRFSKARNFAYPYTDWPSGAPQNILPAAVPASR